MIKTIVRIDGMACGMCESHINTAIRNALDVTKVTSSHKKGIAEIISKDAIDEAALRNALKDTGYEIVGISSEPYKKKGLFW